MNTPAKKMYSHDEAQVLLQVEKDIKEGKLTVDNTLDDILSNAIANNSYYGLEMDEWVLNGEELYAIFYGDVRTFLKEFNNKGN